MPGSQRAPAPGRLGTQRAQQQTIARRRGLGPTSRLSPELHVGNADREPRDGLCAKPNRSRRAVSEALAILIFTTISPRRNDFVADLKISGAKEVESVSA
jgi:hypothetical protein